MRLIVEELGQSIVRLRQQIRPTRSQYIVAVRPHLYKSNNPAGSLRIQITGLDGQLVAQSNAVPIASISTANHFHGYIRFDINASLRADTIYYVELIAEGGYSYSTSDYIGLCKDYDLRRYPADFEPNDGTSSAYDLEFWYLKETL